MTRAHDPCAMCARFTTAGYDQQAAAGMGRCTGFDNEGTPESFVRADAVLACVLFTRRKAESNSRASAQPKYQNNLRTKNAN